MSTPSHVALEGAPFRLWRWACLRGAGLPAALVLDLAASDAAQAADRLLDAEQEKERARASLFAALRGVDPAPAVANARKQLLKWRVPEETGTAADEEVRAFAAAMGSAASASSEAARVFVDARRRVFAAAQRLASDPRVREAVTWQNRGAVENGFASLLRADPANIRSKDRPREALVASYIQRYCAKNDTIGFFGPIGWAQLSAGQPEAIVVAPGPQLVAARRVFFEQWAVDRLAALVSDDARLEPWMAPRRYPFVRIESDALVHSAVTGKQEISAEEAVALRVADGVRTAREIARLLVAGHPTLFAGEGDVLAVFRKLRARQLVAWAFEVPLELDADVTLRQLLERIDDDVLRRSALEPLETLDAARTAVAKAAGNAEAVNAKLLELQSTFTAITGASPSREAGSMYAARHLVFEDCRRDIEVKIGDAVLRELAPPLSLVLASARWFTFEVANAYRDALRAIVADLSKRSKDGRVRFADVWFRSQRLMFGTQDKPVDKIVALLQERWSRILSVTDGARRVELSASDLVAPVRAAFDAPHPGWRAARHHSPDVMIAAKSAEAARNGDFLLVLGEIHVSLNTIDYASWVALHPEPREIIAAHEHDMPDPLLVPVYGKDSPLMTVGTTRALFAPWSYRLESGFDVGPGPRDRTVLLADLLVEESEGELFVRLEDGTRFELVELFGRTLAPIVTVAFQMLPHREHSPRITIDRLVIARESWRFAPSDLAFAFEDDECARFLAARRWMRSRELPRFVFVKVAFETKPIYVDFDSPVFVNKLAKLARAASEQQPAPVSIGVSEMLPSLEETWLCDANDERFTSELRIVAVDDVKAP